MKIDTLSVHAVENFIKKNQIANQAQAKEIRVSAKEMNEISASLAAIMTRIVALTEENERFKLHIQHLQSQLNTTEEINLDGGGFKNVL